MSTNDRHLLTQRQRVRLAKRRMRRSAQSGTRIHGSDASRGWIDTALDHPFTAAAIVFGVLSVVGPGRTIRLASRAATLIATTKGLSTQNR